MLRTGVWIIAAAACVGLVGRPALAQTAAPDPLLSLCAGVLSQGGAGISGDGDKLCTCLVRQTQDRLSSSEMVAYSEATLAGREPPPAVMEKIMSIATGCLAAAQ